MHMKFDRRAALKLIGQAVVQCTVIGGGISASSGATAFPSKESKGRLVEKWMDEWMLKRAPLGALHVSRFRERIWFLTKSIGWKPETSQSANFEPVEVPIGFITDFASIPRAFWSLLPPDGEYIFPAIIHDFLYWTQDRARLEADNIFKVVMQEFEVEPPVRSVIYYAVRIGGEFAWKANARLKADGEKRILKKFPTDPRTRWIDWKKQPDAFE